MSWTEERVEQLKKLWTEGHSASQIANQLGGVTRNAVIGKVHRLGLSGRATPSRPVKRPPRLARPKPTPQRVERVVARPETVAQPGATGTCENGQWRFRQRAEYPGIHVQVADRRPDGQGFRVLRSCGLWWPILRGTCESGFPAEKGAHPQGRWCSGLPPRCRLIIA